MRTWLKNAKNKCSMLHEWSEAPTVRDLPADFAQCRAVQTRMMRSRWSRFIRCNECMALSRMNGFQHLSGTYSWKEGAVQLLLLLVPRQGQQLQHHQTGQQDPIP